MTIMRAKGKKPLCLPLRVQEFYEIERRTIDIFIDSTKNYVSTAGISLSIYAAWVQTVVVENFSMLQRLMLFLPITLWLFTILSGVVAVYPKKYNAKNDFERQKVVIRLRRTKKMWSVITLILFSIGFLFATYIFTAKMWSVYPFNGKPLTEINQSVRDKVQ